MAKAGNLNLDLMANSIGIHFFGFEYIFRCYRDTKTLNKNLGRIDTLMIAGPTSKLQEAGLSVPHTWLFVVSHIDENSIHPKRGYSNRTEAGLRRYIFLLYKHQCFIRISATEKIHIFSHVKFR